MASIEQYRVTSNRLLVELHEAKAKTSFGFELKDDSAVSQGTVVAAGAGRKNRDGAIIENSVKVGERVVFTRGVGISLKFDGHDVTLITEDDVLGVVDDWLV